jgi:hypothetical protein
MIGKLIFGLLLLMAAAVLVNPNLSTPIWNFILSILLVLFYFGIIACMLCIVVLIIVIMDGAKMSEERKAGELSGGERDS